MLVAKRSAYNPVQSYLRECAADWDKSRQAFENDRRRDAKLIAAGYRVIRITWQQITQQSHRVIARIAKALMVARAA